MKKNETNKDKEVKSLPTEYDMTVEQIIPLNLEKNRKIYRVEHVLRPLSVGRFLHLEKEKEDLSRTVSKSQTSTLQPTARLWDELIVERRGYAHIEDVRKTYLMDKVQAVLGLLYARVVSDNTEEPETVDILDAEVLFNDDEPTEIKLEVMQSGAVITTSHFFRPETEAQMDEYLSIISGTPQPGQMASMARSMAPSKAQRVLDLYDEVHLKHYGYAEGTEVPPWHKLPAVMHFFAYQFNRMGV